MPVRNELQPLPACSPGNIPHATLGKWHHIAVTRVASGKVNFYIDFHPAGSVSQAGTFGIKNNYPLHIGAKPDSYSWFEGKIDDICIYHAVLSHDDL
jgi:hypothetical protein